MQGDRPPRCRPRILELGTRYVPTTDSPSRSMSMFFLGFFLTRAAARCPPHFAGQHLPPVQRRIPPQEAAWIRATNPPQARKWAKEDMHEKRYKVGL